MAGNRRQSYRRRGTWDRNKGSGGKIWRVLLLGTGIVAASLYLLVFSPVFWATQVKVEGARTVQTDRLREVALEAVERDFGPLRTRSTLLLDREAVSKAVTQEVRGVSTAEVRTNLPDTLIVSVTERRQALLWKTGGQSYLVDQRGIAFERAAPREGLVTVEDSTDLPVEVGKRLVSSNFITILEEIQEGMKRRGFEVTGFRLPETTFEVQAVTKDGWYALFDTTRPVKSQAEALKLAVSREQPFQYADLRVPGRVYVR